MEIDRHKILEVLYQSIGELNEQRSYDQRLTCSPDTPLGYGSGLDSLAFVNLVALIEEECEERFGRSLVLSSVAGGSACTKDPFDTIGSLAEFIELALQDRTTSRG